MSLAEVSILVDSIIEDYREHPVDMLKLGDAEGEIRYLKGLSESYRRTVQDVHELFAIRQPGARILEIGSYLGVVCRALKQLNYDVHASEYPAFAESENVKALYARHGIPLTAVDLHAAKLPFADGSIDAVVICEVIEHLNFNPLPVLLEISRIIKTDGFIYVAMPNHASLTNRINSFRGKSIHNPISELVDQLDRRRNMEVGLHWREYTAPETCQMLKIVGFNPHLVRHEVPAGYFSANPIKAFVKRILYSMETLRPNQIVVGKKTQTPGYPEWRSGV